MKLASGDFSVIQSGTKGTGQANNTPALVMMDDNAVSHVMSESSSVNENSSNNRSFYSLDEVAPSSSEERDVSAEFLISDQSSIQKAREVVAE